MIDNDFTFPVYINEKILNEIKKISKIASKSFPKATKNGIWGDPRKATKRDGQKLILEIIGNLEKKCQTCLTGHD